MKSLPALLSMRMAYRVVAAGPVKDDRDGAVIRLDMPSHVGRHQRAVSRQTSVSSPGRREITRPIGIRMRSDVSCMGRRQGRR